jgi:hypothetical protein
MAVVLGVVSTLRPLGITARRKRPMHQSAPPQGLGHDSVATTYVIASTPTSGASRREWRAPQMSVVLAPDLTSQVPNAVDQMMDGAG